MGDTTISWCHRPGTRARTWNPTQGCAIKSEGCRNCYAMRQARRFAGPGKPFDGLVNLKTGKWTGKARLAAHKLTEPLGWRQPSTVFVDSMSDLFYEKFTNEEIAAVFGVMAACPQHTFQILTKRPDRMRQWFTWIADQGPDIDNYDPTALACWDFAKAAIATTGAAIESSVWNSEMMDRGHLIKWALANVWLGVSVENQDAADERIMELLRTPAAVRFLSCEPLLGPVDLAAASPNDRSLVCDLDWIIAGAESGPGARACGVSWLRSLRDQCREARIPFFLKQATQAGSEAVGGPLVTLGDGSKRKGGGVIELPYLDGVQHAAFPVMP